MIDPVSFGAGFWSGIFVAGLVFGGLTLVLFRWWWRSDVEVRS